MDWCHYGTDLYRQRLKPFLLAFLIYIMGDLLSLWRYNDSINIFICYGGSVWVCELNKIHFNARIYFPDEFSHLIDSHQDRLNDFLIDFLLKHLFACNPYDNLLLSRQNSIQQQYLMTNVQMIKSASNCHLFMFGFDLLTFCLYKYLN